MEEQFFPNEEDVLGPEDEARVSDEANAAKAQVIGVAEDRDGPSEGVNYQPQRKGNAVFAFGREQAKDTPLLEDSLNDEERRSGGRSAKEVRDLKQREPRCTDEDTWPYVNEIPFQMRRRSSQSANEPNTKNPQKVETMWRPMSGQSLAHSNDEVRLGESAGGGSNESKRLVELVLKCTRRMQAPLPPLEKFAGKGEQAAKFDDFIEELLLRFEHENDRAKIVYLKAFLAGPARDASLGIPLHIRECGSFNEVIHALKLAITDSSKITRLRKQTELQFLKWKNGQSLVEFFAEVDKKVAAACPSTLYTDIAAVDERKCSIAMQALSFEPELAARVHYAVAAAPRGALYNALKQAAVEWERVSRSIQSSYNKRLSWKENDENSCRREYWNGNLDERGGPINGGWRRTQLVHADEGPGLKVRTYDGQPRLNKYNRRSEFAHKQANPRTSQLTQRASKTSDSGNSAGRVANGKGRNEQSPTVCYVCKGWGHTARVCLSATVRRVSVAEAATPEPKTEANEAIELRVTSIEAASQHDDVVGNKLAIELLGDGVPLTALLDSGAMVSLISVTALRKTVATKGAKFLSERIEKGDEQRARIVKDASGNTTKILGKVAIEVAWGRRKKVVLMLVPASFVGEEDIVLGMNALGAYQEWREQMMQVMQAQGKDSVVVAAEAALIPPLAQKLVQSKVRGPSQSGKLCNDRGGRNALGAAKLLRAINNAYDVNLAIHDNWQRFDTINKPQCSDAFNSPRQWRDVDTTTSSRSSLRGQHHRRQLQGRSSKPNLYRQRGSGAKRHYY